MGNILDEWAQEYWKKKLDNWVKEPKYKNKKVIIDGLKFDSHKEANRYLELKTLEKKGIIKDLRNQVRFELQSSYKKKGKTIRAINYIADFTYLLNGKLIVEDTKGYRTEVYKLKKKIFEYVYPDLEIKEI